MKKPYFISPLLLLAFLMYIGCKGEEKPALSFRNNVPLDEARSVQVEGTWVIDSLTLPSVTVPSFCNKIGAGATFEFTANNSLKVYSKDASEPCETYSYTAQQDLIHLTKGDMIMLVKVKSLTNEKLVLSSNSFFRWEGDIKADSSAYQTMLKEGVTVFLSKK